MREPVGQQESLEEHLHFRKEKRNLEDAIGQKEEEKEEIKSGKPRE